MKNQDIAYSGLSLASWPSRRLALLVIFAAGITAAGAQDVPARTTPSGSTLPKEASTLSREDKNFITKAARASTSEVALSQLADSRASNPEVKAFAQMMITDHGQANADLFTLATSKGFDIAQPVNKGKMDNVPSLSAKAGADFDKVYTKLMASAHKGAVDLFKEEVAKGKDADVVAFAQKYVDALSMHLTHATALEKTIGQ